jgi:hypothetical protein
MSHFQARPVWINPTSANSAKTDIRRKNPTE